MHRWASHGLVLVVFLHLLRVFYTAAYHGSRKTNWIIGICMFLITVLMSFSGYLLPWDQLSFWAVTIGSNIAGSFRELTDLLGITDTVDIGGFVKGLLIGGEDVGQPALTRFYMMHIVLLPVSMMILIGYHFWRIRKDGGLSHHKKYLKDEENIFSWPSVMWAELAIFISSIAILLLIATFIDGPLKEPANPSFPENPAKSPWYLLGIQELVSYSAFSGGWLIPSLFLVFLFLLPYRDKNDTFLGLWFSGRDGARLTIVSMILSLVFTVMVVTITILYGAPNDWWSGSSRALSIIINPATLLAIIFIGWSFWMKKKTSSGRMAAIALFTCSITSLLIFTVIGIWFRGPDWNFVWPF
jgi:quinol-cytochrome oxidoreductase complex cytochrome b subunit